MNENIITQTPGTDVVRVSHIGVMLVFATPMTRQAYNDFRGWQLPADENGSHDGYLVEYSAGGAGVTWIPKRIFDFVYNPISGLSFGFAIEALKQGQRVARAGWNGKGMWLRYIEPYAPHPDDSPEASPRNPYFKAWDNNPEAEGTMLPWIGMKTADNKFVPWLASQTDMLAEDWYVLGCEA